MSLKKVMCTTGLILTTGVVLGVVLSKTAKEKLEIEKNKEKFKKKIDEYKKEAKKVATVMKCKKEELTKEALSKIIDCSQEMLDDLCNLSEYETEDFLNDDELCETGHSCSCPCEEVLEKAMKEAEKACEVENHESEDHEYEETIPDELEELLRNNETKEE